MRRAIFKGLLPALFLMLLCGFMAAGAEDSAVRNAILVTDGSGADAARLLYENLLAEQAGDGSPSGMLGAVLYSGQGGWLSLGPLSLNADREALDAAIGEPLSAADGGVSGDLAAALRRVRAMLRGFDNPAATDVFLLADGSGSGGADPRAIGQAEKLREEGAALRVIALTAPDGEPAEPIRQLTEAGGGSLVAAGEGDLSGRALETLFAAESGAGSVSVIAGSTPLKESFTVPYDGITSAAVSIAFAPGQRGELGDISLTSPGGLTFDLTSEGIAVREGRSYILLEIPAPEAGEWTLSIGGAGVPVSILPRLNHNLRLKLNMRSLFDAGETMLAEAWFQKYDGSAYVDLTDSELYEQTEATLLLYAPGANMKGEPTLTLPMTYDGSGHYRASYDPEGLGIWTARVRVRNDYLAEELKYNAFEVTNAPTPTPLPTATPMPEVAELGGIHIEIEGLVTDGEGSHYIDGGSKTFRATWTVEGETDSVKAALLRDGKQIMTGLKSGDALPTSKLQKGHDYALRVYVVPKNGSLTGMKPITEEVAFRLAPVLGKIEGIAIDVQPRMEGEADILIPRDAEAVTLAWTIEGDPESAEGALLEDGSVIREGLRSGEAVARSLLKDGAVYTLRVSALPENGGLLGAEAAVEELSFSLYPEALPIEGLKLDLPGATPEEKIWRFEGGQAQLTWSASSGDVERYILRVTDADGAAVITQGLPGTAKGYVVDLPKNGDYTAELIAVPRYAREGDMNATVTLTLRPHIPSFLEKYWPFLAGGAGVLLVILLVVLLLLRRKKGGGRSRGGKAKVDKKATYIVGTLHVYCEELDLDVELKFDKPKKTPDGTAAVKEGEPITAHPELAKLKGEEAHRLLNGVKLSMARADGSGRVEGEKKSPGHQPNAALIGLTSLLPTGAKEVRYVGEYDIGEVTLRRRSPDGDYDFIFWGAARPRPVSVPERPAEPAIEPAEPEAPAKEKPIDLDTLADQVLAAAIRPSGNGAGPQDGSDAPKEERPRVSLSKHADAPQDGGSTGSDAPEDERPALSLKKHTDAPQDGGPSGSDAPQETCPRVSLNKQTDEQPGSLASAHADMLNAPSDEEEAQSDEQAGSLASAYADMINAPSDEDDEQGSLASAYADMLNAPSDEDEAKSSLASAYADASTGSPMATISWPTNSRAASPPPTPICSTLPPMRTKHRAVSPPPTPMSSAGFPMGRISEPMNNRASPPMMRRSSRAGLPPPMRIS